MTTKRLLPERHRRAASNSQFRGCCVALGNPPTNVRFFSSLWTLFGPPLYLEAPATWLSLLRRLWQFWVASSVLLLWDLLCVIGLWSAGFVRGRELLLSTTMVLALPPGAWLSWLLPICHYAHEQPGPPPYSVPPGGWRAICALAMHVLFCGLATMGPAGWALPGVLVAYDMFRCAAAHSFDDLEAASLYNEVRTRCRVVHAYTTHARTRMHTLNYSPTTCRQPRSVATRVRVHAWRGCLGGTDGLGLAALPPHQ